MDIASAIFVVLPVFGLIGIGYVAAWTGLLKAEIGEALGKFVYTVSLPALLFKSLGTAHYGDGHPWLYWAVYFFAAALSWMSASLVVTRLFGREKEAGIIAGVSAGFSNLVMLGIPFVISAFGEAGAAPLFLIVSVHLPIMMTVTTILFARHGAGEGNPFVTVLRNLVTSPLVLGIVAGGLWRLTGLPIEGVAAAILDKLIAAAVPCALFSIGMGLTAYGIRGNVRPAIVISVLKLLIMPATVYLLGTHVAHLPPLWVAVATIGAACPTGVNAWLFANHFGTGLAISANSITLTTAMAVVTMSGWLIFLGTP